MANIKKNKIHTEGKYRTKVPNILVNKIKNFYLFINKKAYL